MATFVGTGGGDDANAALGHFNGFTGGTLAQLQDNIGDSIFAFGGDDIIFAGNGNDDIEGWEGHDTINGGGGNDRIWAMQISNVDGSLVGDEITGNDGNDTIYGSGGADSIDGSADFDELYGGGGDDFLQGGTGADSVSGGDGNDTIYATDWIGTAEESQYGNILKGDAGNDTVVGSGNDDLITGGTGRDTLIGGAGIDQFYTRAGELEAGESIAGGAGHDEILLGDGSYDFRQVTVAGIDELRIAALSNGSDAVRATFLAVQIKALPDMMIDSAGSPGVLEIHMGNETRLELDALKLSSDWRQQDGDHVKVVGDAQAEIILGSRSADLLFGGGGNDRLDGGIGGDSLRGGAARDSFVFDNRGATDHILDFRSRDDTIRLDDDVFRALGRGRLDSSEFKDIGRPGARIDRSDHVIYDSDTGRLFYDSNGSAAGGRFKIAELDNEATIGSADFFVV